MSAGGRSRTAALGLLLGVVAIILAAVIVPLALYWADTGRTIRDARAKLQAANAQQTASLEADDARLKWTEFAATPASRFVIADSDAAAIDLLRSRLQSLFSERDGEAGPITVEAVEGPRAGVIALKIEARGTLTKSSLGPFLTALESGAQIVILNRFSARSIDRNRLRISLSGTAYRMGEPET